MGFSIRDGEPGAKADRQGSALSDRDTDPQHLNKKRRADLVLVTSSSQQVTRDCQGNLYQVQGMCKDPCKDLSQ